MSRPRPAAPSLSRRVGRSLGRWWRRYGPGVRGATAPARRRWTTAVAYAWFAGYMWVGMMLSVTAQRLIGGSSPYVVVTAVGGGAALGYWQARHRLARHIDPTTAPMRRFGLALCAWLGLIGLAILISLR